jgi:hypothetical protein
MIDWMIENPELAGWAQFFGSILALIVAIAAPYLQVNAERASSAAALSALLSPWITSVANTQHFFEGEHKADQRDLDRLKAQESAVRAFPQSSLSPSAIARLQTLILYASSVRLFLEPLDGLSPSSAASGLATIVDTLKAWRALGDAAPQSVQGVDRSWFTERPIVLSKAMERLETGTQIDRSATK